MARPLHVRKFQGGRISVQDYHANLAFGPHARCNGCGARPTVRAITLAPYDEAMRRGLVPPGPEASAAILAASCMIKGADGNPVPHVRLGKAFSCPLCRPAFERQLAKLPSWVVVDINRGPDPTHRVAVGA